MKIFYICFIDGDHTHDPLRQFSTYLTFQDQLLFWFFELSCYWLCPIFINKCWQIRIFLSELYLIIMAQINEDFFEQQRIFTLLCGMHSINNLLAAPIYSKQQMNNICYQLSDAFINPHKHILGGDYDANVVLIALQNQQCTTKWHDRRKQFAIREAINEEGQELQLIGYIINKFQGEGILNKIFRFSPRHWIAVRKEGQKYRFLDSSEEATEVCTREEVFRRISELLVNNNEPEQSNEVIEVYRAK